MRQKPRLTFECVILFHLESKSFSVLVEIYQSHIDK